MKKQFFILLMLVSLGATTYAQHEYRLSKSSGTLKINLSNVIIEGYDGKEIIFNGEKIAIEETDERAKGLMAINASGYTDNTGLGISVTENAQEIIVKASAKKPVGLIKIKVPQGLKISMLEGSNRIFYSNVNKSDIGEIVLRNLKNEIEISVYNNKIKLENNTGPMNVKTVTGPIEAIFDGEIKGPISLTSVTDYVDITLPSSTKANIEMATGAGKIYAAREFNIDFEKQEPRSVSYSITTDYPTRLSTDRTVKVGTQLSKDGTTITGKNGTGNQVKDVTITANSSTGGVITTKGQKTDNVVILANGSIAQGTDVKKMIVDGKVITPDQSGHFTTGDLNFASSSFYFGGEKVKGKMNGGGVDLIFKSNSKNVYLRQK